MDVDPCHIKYIASVEVCLSAFCTSLVLLSHSFKYGTAQRQLDACTWVAS